jgi:hypothetical protein
MEAKKEELIEKLTNISHSPERAVFLNKDISGLHLTNLKINGVLFRRCNFYATEFYDCSFQNCEFLDCDFGGTLLADVTFLNCNLVECDFKESKMQDVNFEGGFKSNNNFERLEILRNVNGISPDESSIISDDIEQTSITEKLDQLYTEIPFNKSGDYYKIAINDVDVVIGQDEGDIWRVMIGRETGPNIEDYESLQSLTFDENITSDELYDTIISAIEGAINLVNKDYPDDVDTPKKLNSILNMFKNANLINEECEANKCIELTIDDIDMLEQISSALNHVENNMLDDMVLGEISNLLIKYEEFMNNKIRN